MRRRTRGRIHFERFLLLTGLGCVGIWIFSVAGTAVYQDWGNWAFNQKLRREPAGVAAYLSSKIRRQPSPHITDKPAIPVPAQAPRILETGAVIGRLAIPRLHLSSMVREGSGETTLAIALGHIPGTAIPGEKGNVGVAGHRDKLFRGLRNIQNNDLIEFQTLSGAYSYRVERTDIVSPRDVGVLKPGPHAELTLVTCYPFYYVGPAPNRYIVRAREVTPAATTEQPGASPQASPQAISRLKEPMPAQGRTMFSLSTNHSRQLAPGVSIGLTDTNIADHQLNGWLWLAAEHRTIWLHNQTPQMIYGASDGRTRRLVITGIGSNSITGYLAASS